MHGAASYHTIWADNYGKTDAALFDPNDESQLGWMEGNWTEGDTDVDGADYTVWADNYGKTCGDVFAPVPEPLTLVLLAGGAAVLIRRKR